MKVLFILLLSCSSVFASDVICYDENNLVTSYHRSVSTPDYLGCLVNPELSGVLGVDIKYWIVDAEMLREMTIAEKTIIDDEIAQAIIDSENVRRLEFDDSFDASVEADAVLNKIDTRIDAISSYADLKLFLKKLARYTYKTNKNYQ